MIFEIIAILNWFNPVVYLYKKDIKHIHEFIADDIAAQNEKSKLDYAMLLFTQEFGLQPDQLTNSFFTHSTLKRRIQMLSKPKSHRIMILKYWLSVPLFVLMLVLSSAGIAKNKVLDLVEVQLSDLNKKSIGIERHTDNFSEETVVITDARIISGKVTTATDGRPLPGVDVEVIGKKRGTSTDADGHFKISASEGEKLRFSFLGFETAVVEVGSKTTIDIALKMKQPERVALNEVKVTTSKKTVWGHDELIFESVDENPEYPGGVKQMYEFIADNIKYPMEAERNEISGKVFVKFIVRKDGSISDLKVLKGIGSGCDEETIRVLSQMPKWTPGKHNGEPVNVMFTMPVNFELNYEKHANGVALPRSSDTFKLRGINGKEQIFILDGKEIKKEELNQLEPGKIETVTVLKDNEAVKIYGEKGRDGVIIIKTKLFPEQTKK
jgi:TonB family protein